MRKIFYGMVVLFLAATAAIAQVTTTIGGTTYNLSGSLTASLVPNQPVGVDFTPVMAAQVTGQWTASATSEYSSGGQTANAWRALTAGNQPTWTDKWSSAVQATSGAPQSWRLQSSSPFQITSLHLISRPDANTLEALSFQIVDNTNGGAVLYDTGATPLSWANGEEKTFAFTTTVTQDISIVVRNGGALCQFKVRLFS